MSPGHHQSDSWRWRPRTGSCNGCLLLARYELSRDQALLDRAIAVVTALTRRIVAVSNSIGFPKMLSVKIVETVENISRRMAALSPDAAQLHLHKALVLIDFARLQREFGSSELERTHASQADSLLKGLAAKRLAILPGSATSQLPTVNWVTCCRLKTD
jgi:hypothetical protein